MKPIEVYAWQININSLVLTEHGVFILYCNYHHCLVQIMPLDLQSAGRRYEPAFFVSSVSFLFSSPVFWGKISCRIIAEETACWDVSNI
jgi:hypothetical protein